MKKLLLITATVFSIQTSNAQTFDYFGQTLPGKTSVVFAPEILSISNTTQLRFAFSPDGNEFYYTVYSGQDDSFKIYFTKRNNNAWTAPQEASFSVNRKVLSPFISADGKRLYFTEFNSASFICKIYMVERNAEGGWGEPKLLPSPINVANDGNYVETADGVGYLDSSRPGSLDSNGDIWCIRRNTDQSLKAESLGSIVNTKDQDSYPCVAPDGSFLIFSSTRSGKYGNQDLFISFNKGNNVWTVPISMEKSGAKINIAKSFQDYPSISPDGKFLFFRRANNDFSKSDIYWVSTSVIDTLKKIAMPTVSVKKSIEQKAMLYPNPTKGLIAISLGTSQSHESLVEIHNLQGTQVFSITFQNTTSATIDLTGNAAGIYVVKVISDETCYEEKIVKE
jgi:Tol biopolymer transport system component